jgi:protein-tyrosine-phosphatase
MKSKRKDLNSILFVCNINSIRSPMAESILKVWFDKKIFIDSCGIRKGKIDHMAIEVMAEDNFDLSNHNSKLFSSLQDTSFDLIITFTKEAFVEVTSLTKTQDCEIEYLKILDASQTTGNRQQRLDSYRQVRDLLKEKLNKRFKDYI